MPSSLFQTLTISRQDILDRMKDLDVTSNNLSNVNTAGYKTSRSNFQEMLNQQLKEGTQLRATQMLPMQGTLADSTSTLDWAVRGEGFFSVTLPDGTTGYTRDGSLTLDADRQLVTAAGYKLVLEGEIPEGTTNISIAADGKVTGLDADGANVDLGTVQLTIFPNPSGLKNFGDNVWLETDSSGAAQAGDPGTQGYGTIVGSKIEQSNVDIAQEMTHLMVMQRSISMSLKAFEQTDSMISQAINLRKA